MGGSAPGRSGWARWCKAKKSVRNTVQKTQFNRRTACSISFLLPIDWR